jgi:hypothetical protein
MRKIKGRRGEEGIALVITLLIMTILLIMGSAFMSISSTESLIAINERNRIQAYHLAEAGAERAIAELNADSSYAGAGTPLEPDPTLGPGAYRVTVACVPTGAPPCPPVPPGSPDQRFISAMGCVRDCTAVGRATSTVEVRVQRVAGSPFKFAMLGVGSGAADYRALQLEDNVQVDSYNSAAGPYNPFSPGTQGDLHSNGKIELATDSLVKGDAKAVGAVTLGSGSTIEGGYTTGVPSESVVSITYPPYSGSTTGILPAGYYDTATHHLNVPNDQTVWLNPGTYSFDKITMGENSKLVILPSGQVTIYMTGRFNAGKKVKINQLGLPTNLLIFSNNTGTDDAGGEEAFFFCCDDGSEDGEFYGAIYAPNGEVEVQNATVTGKGWKIFGAMVAKKLDIEDYAQFHYDLALAQASIPGMPGTKFKPVAGAWQERLPSN